MKTERGFSMLEMIVILAIVGILAAMAAPRLESLFASHGNHLKVLERHLLEVRQVGMQTRQSVGIRFWNTPVQYEGVVFRNGRPHTLDNGRIAARMSFESVRLSNGRAFLRFDEEGRPVQENGEPVSGVITLTFSRGEDDFGLRIDPLTGNVSR